MLYPGHALGRRCERLSLERGPSVPGDDRQAHRRGACVFAVCARDVAEIKAKEATELGKNKGYPLSFTTEPEE